MDIGSRAAICAYYSDASLARAGPSRNSYHLRTLQQHWMGVCARGGEQICTIGASARPISARPNDISTRIRFCPWVMFVATAGTCLESDMVYPYGGRHGQIATVPLSTMSSALLPIQTSLSPFAKTHDFDSIS